MLVSVPGIEDTTVNKTDQNPAFLCRSPGIEGVHMWCMDCNKCSGKKYHVGKVDRECWLGHGACKQDNQGMYCRGGDIWVGLKEVRDADN